MRHSILHLCYDDPFIDNSRLDFEAFYPGQNIFCVVPRPSIKKHLVKMKEAIWLERGKPDIQMIQKMCQEKSVDIIVLHGIDPDFLTILRTVNSDKSYRVFWLFYGNELYYALGEKTDYPLMDNNSVFSFGSWIAPTKYNYWLRKILRKPIYYEMLEELLQHTDYFCFWLYEDYLLLKKYFNTDIEFRHFQYNMSSRLTAERMMPNYNKTPNEIRIGHSASKTENQETIIKLISEIDKNNVYKKVFPLTYGSTYYRNIVTKMGERFFGNQFCPILTHVSRDDYNRALSQTGVAIFGMNRQEASGNIFPLLKSGAKVFLRENNVLLEHCKKQGYLVFSVEKDLKCLDDLQPLTPEQMDHNSEIGWKNQVFSEDFMPQLFD